MSYEHRHDVAPDPEGMRELARSLRADARELEGVATGMRSAVGSMDFEGPAADRFEHKVRPRIKDLRELAERLEALARVLVETAEEIERERRRRMHGDGNELVADRAWAGS